MNLLHTGMEQIRGTRDLQRALAGLVFDIIKNPSDMELRWILADCVAEITGDDEAVEPMRSKEGYWTAQRVNKLFHTYMESEGRVYWHRVEHGLGTQPVGVGVFHPSRELIMCSRSNHSMNYVHNGRIPMRAGPKTGWKWVCSTCCNVDSVPIFTAAELK